MATQRQIDAAAERRQNHMGGLHYVDPYRPRPEDPEADEPQVEFINGRPATEHEQAILRAAILEARRQGR